MAYFDTMARNWSDRYRARGHFRKRLETALSWLDASAGQRLRLLDFGCGSGVLMNELLQLGHEVHGADSSPGMIEHAGKELLAFSPVSLELIKAEDYGGHYLARSYDGVFCLGVIEYVDNPDLLLKQLASVIKPGGFLVLSVPNRTSLLRRVEMFVFRHGRWFRKVPKLKNLVGDESYLKFQKHQFTKRGLDETVCALGLVSQASIYHVTPGALGLLEGYPAMGMTLITKYVNRPTENAPR